MAFTFRWPQFSAAFYRDAREMLSQALNKGETPPIIADRIDVRELNMGTMPPDLEMLEIGDLSKERFRGIFRLTYTGDAFIELQTAIQANPLNQQKPTIDALPSPSILFASAPLKVPMRLRLSALRLRAIIVLVVSRSKGITLVFKNDPLESVTVSSTFDSVAVIQGFIQREIEGQLREMFRADLPGIIHRLSQRWLADTARLSYDARDRFDLNAHIETRTEMQGDVAVSTLRMRPSSLAHSPSKRSVSGGSTMHRSSMTSLSSSYASSPAPPRLASDLENMSVADSIEAYDPSYGLRPEGIAHTSPLRLQGRLFSTSSRSTRGLGDVLLDDNDNESEPPEADESFEEASQASSFRSPRSVQEYESYPAIGGGLITRPRVLHAQSQMVLPTLSNMTPGAQDASDAGGSTATAVPDQDIWQRRAVSHSVHRLAHTNPSTPLRSSSPSLSRSHQHQYFAPRSALGYGSVGSSSHHSPRSPFSRGSSSLFVPTIASSRTSAEPPSRSPSPPNASEDSDVFKETPPSPPPLLSAATAGITLTTSANNDRCAHLTTLGQTHNTLSPLTRHLEHVAARSHVLMRGASRESAPILAHGPRKARRKRLHVLGSPQPLAVESLPARHRTITEESMAWEERSDGGLSTYFPRSSSPETSRSTF